jgi:hypothetical protein
LCIISVSWHHEIHPYQSDFNSTRCYRTSLRRTKEKEQAKAEKERKRKEKEKTKEVVWEEENPHVNGPENDKEKEQDPLRGLHSAG